MEPTARLGARLRLSFVVLRSLAVVAAVLFAWGVSVSPPRTEKSPRCRTLSQGAGWVHAWLANVAWSLYAKPLLSRNYRSNTESTERHRSKQKLGVGIRIGNRLALLFAIAQSASVLGCSS